MNTTVKIGCRKIGHGKSSRGLGRVRYVGALTVLEDGQHRYSYTGNVQRLMPADALADARTEAESLQRQNPTIALTITE